MSPRGAVSLSVLIGCLWAPYGVQAGPFDLLKETGALLAKPQATDQVAPASLQGAVSQANVNYAGYSKNFQATKQLLEQGDAVEAYQLREGVLIARKIDPNVLFSLEQALISLDAGQGDDAIEYLDHAEVLLEKRQNKSVTSGFLSKITTGAVRATGFDEFGQYDGEPFERILMLNFKSIAYMLDGNRKAYNVTRRAIDWQNIEKKKFDQKIEAVKEEIKATESAQAKKGNDLTAMGLVGVINDQYKSSEATALKVPSAFVNPFGFYMAGVVQEFDSYEDKSLRDNARISYQKALELNPTSVVLKQAVKEIKKSAPKNKRLVQVVVANGFAPEKKVLRLDYNINGTNVPVKLTMYEPDETAVSRIEIQNKQGKRLAKLGVVADIDTLVLRYQYDSLPEQHLKMTVSIVRSVLEGKLFQKAGFLGTMGKKFRDDSTFPDMRSWMSMPKQILAARLYLPKNMADLQLVSFDSKGKVLVRKKLVLDASNHSFVFARSLDNIMYTNQSTSMWVAMR